MSLDDSNGLFGNKQIAEVVGSLNGDNGFTEIVDLYRDASSNNFTQSK